MLKLHAELLAMQLTHVLSEHLLLPQSNAGGRGSLIWVCHSRQHSSKLQLENLLQSWVEQWDTSKTYFLHSPGGNIPRATPAAGIS